MGVGLCEKIIVVVSGETSPNKDGIRNGPRKACRPLSKEGHVSFRICSGDSKPEALNPWP